MGASGTYATADQGLATMQGLTFFEGGFAMLDVSRGRWMPIQHPIRGAVADPKKDAGGDVVMADAGGIATPPTTLDAVWEHRTGTSWCPLRTDSSSSAGWRTTASFRTTFSTSRFSDRKGAPRAGALPLS